MQKYPAFVFALISVIVLFLSRTVGWSRPGQFVLVILLGMSIFGFLMSLFPRGKRREVAEVAARRR